MPVVCFSSASTANLFGQTAAKVRASALRCIPVSACLFTGFWLQVQSSQLPPGRMRNCWSRAPATNLQVRLFLSCPANSISKPRGHLLNPLAGHALSNLCRQRCLLIPKEERLPLASL